MFSFNDYTSQQLKNWEKSKRILIYKNEEMYLKFIDFSLGNSEYKKKLYFGTISKEHANEILLNTGVDVEGFNCALSADEVRKINSSHGDEKKENVRGQRAYTVEDYLVIPFVILSADVVERSTKDYRNKPALLFHKQIGDESFTVVTGISNKHLDVFVQTSWITKKRNLATPIAE